MISPCFLNIVVIFIVLAYFVIFYLLLTIIYVLFLFNLIFIEYFTLQYTQFSFILIGKKFPYSQITIKIEIFHKIQ